MINKKYIALFLMLIFFVFCAASQWSIHPPWNQDGNVLYIEKFGKTGYLIMKTFTSSAINAAGQSYAKIALEYRHSDTRWYISQANGAWVPYD